MKIEKIEELDYSDKVYSLGVDDNKNYFLSNNVLSSNSLMVLDEAQNANLAKLMLFTTRMGKESKVIISGDIRQYDIKKNQVGLLFFRDMIKDIPGVACFEFSEDDIMRNDILKEIVKRYEIYKESPDAPKSHNS